MKNFNKISKEKWIQLKRNADMYEVVGYQFGKNVTYDEVKVLVFLLPGELSPIQHLPLPEGMLLAWCKTWHGPKTLCNEQTSCRTSYLPQLLLNVEALKVSVLQSLNLVAPVKQKL